MRIAVVGVGAAGQARLSAYRAIEGARVEAVVDPWASSVALGVPHYRTLDDLLTKVEVDVVDICAPPAAHGPLSTQALRAGVHVICEKPVATSTSDAVAMVELSRQRGRLLYPAHNYGFSPMMTQLARVMSAVGSPATATFRILRATHARGTQAWQPDWRRDPAIACGGILVDHGTHCVYMATRLFGAAPTAVSCVLDRCRDGVDEYANLSLAFEHGTCDVELSWRSDVRTNEYTLRGPAGCLTIRDGVATLDTADGRTVWDLVSPTNSSTHEEWFAAMFADFAGRVAANDFDGPLDECVLTARITELAYRSARLGGDPLPIFGECQAPTLRERIAST